MDNVENAATNLPSFTNYPDLASEVVRIVTTVLLSVGWLRPSIFF